MEIIEVGRYALGAIAAIVAVALPAAFFHLLLSIED